jgi:hypothetical protein
MACCNRRAPVKGRENATPSNVRPSARNVQPIEPAQTPQNETPRDRQRRIVRSATRRATTSNGIPILN